MKEGRRMHEKARPIASQKWQISRLRLTGYHALHRYYTPRSQISFQHHFHKRAQLVRFITSADNASPAVSRPIRESHVNGDKHADHQLVFQGSFHIVPADAASTASHACSICL